MNIIDPSVELVDEIDSVGILQKIERCGRVCYQSQPKEGETANFVSMLIKRGHESVLEHVSLTFHIICDRAIMSELTRHRLLRVFSRINSLCEAQRTIFYQSVQK